MRAEILAIGSELLSPARLETNAAYLTGRLLEAGIPVVARSIVADDLGLLTSAFATALGRAELVIATGGLVLTADDLTREAAAAALGRPVQRDPTLLAALEARFARFGRQMAPVNARQADLIAGAQAIANANGTAPGQRLDAGAGRLLILLPGPPREMRPMFDEQVLPGLNAAAGRTVLRTRSLRIAGLSESEVEQAVAPLYTRYDNPRTTILGGPGQVELQLVALGATADAAELRLEALATEIRRALPDRIYSEDGHELHEVVAALLQARQLRLALAESCTGGRLAARLTDVPGASRFLERACVTYSNRAKVELLGVDPALIEASGAVSQEVALAMARGACRTAATDLGLGITGIAGPDGGSQGKPVGLVYIALAGSLGESVRRFQFPGDRERIRMQAVQNALELLRRAVLGLPQ